MCHFLSLECVAPFEAHAIRSSLPRPHEVFDLCALGLPQVKADGLVVVVAKLMSLINDRATREKLSKIINKIIIKIYFV